MEMTERTGPKIHLDGSWIAVDQPRVAKIAEVNEGGSLSAQSQAILLALGRANNGGHATFKPGELASLLGKPASVDLKTGEVIPAKPMTRGGLYKVIKGLADAGLLASTETGDGQCLWLNSAVAQRSKQHGGWECPVHRTFERRYT